MTNTLGPTPMIYRPRDPDVSDTEITRTAESIYFFFDHNGMVVAKNSFAYDEEKNRFLSFAKRHVKAFVTE